jgi:hypothetical protein
VSRPRRPPDITIYFAKMSIIRETFPVSVVTIDKTSLSTIDRAKDGSVTITTNMVGEDGRIIANIVNDEWHVKPNNIFYMKNPKKAI